MSIDSRPSLLTGGGGDISHTAIAGNELGASHLAAETQLSSHADIAAARNFFQPAGAGVSTPAFTTSGAEATAVAGKAAAAVSGAASSAEASAMSTAIKSVGGLASAAGSEAAAMGAHALAGVGSAAAAAGAEISPMIQLIMRLPGIGGVAQDFFEWLMALFTAPAHLAEVFDPNMWAHLGASLQSSLSNLAAHGISAEHFQVPLSMLPANAPFLQQLGMQAGHGLTDLNRFSTLGTGMSSNGLTSSFSLNNHLNISSPLDLRKPQFEMGSTVNVHSGLSLDGKISGPQLSNSSVNSNFLSGTQRLFSDQISKPSSLLTQSSTGGSAGNFVSNASTPAGSAGSSMNISSNSFQTQDMAGAPANYRISDGVMSGPSISSNNNVGFHLSDSAPASFDKAPALSPSGAVSDTLGGKELLASNDVPSYQPSMGGSYFKPAQAGGPSGGDTPAPAGMTELKAEPMSLLKKAHPSMGHTPDKGAVDYIGHQSKGALHSTQASSSSSSSTGSSATHQSQSMDQIAHRGSPGHANAERQIASKISQDPSSHAPEAKHIESHHVMDKVSHTAAHHVQQAAKPHVHQVERASAQAAKPGSGQEQMQAQSPEQAANAEKTAMSDAGADKLSNYHVQHGDNLWEIAKKQLGDGSRWSEIYKLNSDLIGNNPDLIHTGIDLKMPGADTTQISDAGNYTVQPGDNLWDIAKGKLGDGSRWGEIYDANKAVIGDNPRLIFSGEHLQMPGAQQAISQAAPAPTNLAMQSAPALDPGAAAAQPMPPQAMAPQSQGFQPQVEQQVMVGPGAAGAATLDPSQMPSQGQSQGPVSASLAPDLSFLYNNGKSN